MNKKMWYWVVGIAVVVLLSYLFFFLNHAGKGWDTDFPKDTKKLKAEPVLQKMDTIAYSNPIVAKSVYHWQPEIGDFTIADVERLSKSIYDTVSLKTEFDNPDDSISREFSDLVFFVQDSIPHAIAVVENRGPFYGVSVGWCDVFAFRKEHNKWKLIDFMLEAGGGGMYGSPGELGRLELIGNQTVGIVLKGGQEHMGGNYHEDILGLSQGKLDRITSITTHHDYGSGAGDDFKTTVCDENEFKFVPNGRAMYDLKITRFNCLGEQNKKVKEITIPYQNGYKIPAFFVFES
jgi:hypothetical protein